MSKKSTTPDNEAPEEKNSILGHCGVIMPISNTDGYVNGHWQQVLNLVKKAAIQAGFTCEMVSDNTFSNIMHANIITNIFTNDLVVCDVSSSNSNVMLELGLRLASKKPVVIIFDGEGSYPFDMNQLFYVKYDKGLRYYETEDFIKRLSERITNTYISTKPDSPQPYKPYLNYFTDIQIEASDINRKTVDLIEAIELLAKEVAGIKSTQEIKNSNNFESNYVKTKKYNNSHSSWLLSELIDYILNNNKYTPILKKLNTLEEQVDYIIFVIIKNYTLSKNTPISQVIATADNAYLKSIALDILNALEIMKPS